MKRIFSIVLCFALLLGICAAATVTGSAEAEFTKTAMQYVSEINMGINVGNSLDVAQVWGGETGWGNPKIAKGVFTAIKEKGFNTVRIPVTWFGRKSTAESSNYTVSASLMTRVKQVVNYAIDEGLRVVLNAHHDGEWLVPIKYLSDGYTIDEEGMTSMLNGYSKLWSQIADVFKDYGENLMFESMNEVREGNNWSGYYEAYLGINRINQTFVDAVRKAGGNNDKRYLVVKAYAGGGLSKSSLSTFKIPDDPANHIIFSFHSYSPSDFAFDPADSGKPEQTKYVEEDLVSSLETALKKAKTNFIDNGVPVIIGEFGSVNKNNTEERIKHAKKYVSLAAEYNIKCFWWDDGGKYNLVDRTTFQWKNTIADEMLAIANEHVGEMPETKTTAPTTTVPTTTIPTTTAPQIKYGDVTGDGNIDAKDILRLRKYIARWDVEIDEAAADVTGDGKIDAKDILRLRKYIAHWDVVLGK